MRSKKYYIPILTPILLHMLTSKVWANEHSLDEAINQVVAPWTDRIFQLIFFSPFTLAGQDVPFILLWLVGAGVFLTIYFRFINLRLFGLALRTVKGNYSKPDDPGEITHFQALTAALSATVGLGNI
ncbi:MAG: alanine glycine permease, partial [Verrucomicrobiota bacterium]|nr:alanine glycine permease [Verrucomicrobiota bacterium]